MFTGNQPVYIRAAAPIPGTQGLIGQTPTIQPQRAIQKVSALVQPTARGNNSPTPTTPPVTIAKTTLKAPVKTTKAANVAKIQPAVQTQQQRQVQVS